MLLLAALAGGAGGEAGKQAWSALSTLVRRPFQRTEATSTVSSGEAELAALEQVPGPEQANALSTALAVRAVLDPQFYTSLQQWHDQAKLVRTGDAEVTNTINNSTFHAPVLQGRDISGVSIAATHPAAPPATSTTPPN